MKDIISNLIQERQVLDSKIVKIKEFVDSLNYPMESISNKELQYIGMMIEQLRIMKGYSDILGQRISLITNSDIRIERWDEN